MPAVFKSLCALAFCAALLPAAVCGDLNEPVHYEGSVFSLLGRGNEGALAAPQDASVQTRVREMADAHKEVPLNAEAVLKLIDETAVCRRYSTVDMRDCASERLHALDFVLEHNYRLVIGLLTNKEAEELRAFETAWVEASTLYARQEAVNAWGGTLAPLLVDGELEVWAVKRARQLGSLFEVVRGSKERAEEYPVVF